MTFLRASALCGLGGSLPPSKKRHLRTSFERVRPLFLSGLLFACTLQLEPDPLPPDLGSDPQDVGEPTEMDMGMVLPCAWDQGPATGGCPSGEVCDLLTGLCGPGRSCTQQQDCHVCGDLTAPEPCGHGLELTAWCDQDHGNVCTRARAPCEPCERDEDCGRAPQLVGGNQNRCLTYVGGRFCGRACALGCPAGFVCDAETEQCRNPSGCAPPGGIERCPLRSDPEECQGTAQLCPGTPCPGGGGCVTNDLPGALGLCLPTCARDVDCPKGELCHPINKLCVRPCDQGMCAQGMVCQGDGLCGARCAVDADCTMNPRFGPQTYCNLAGRGPPRAEKTYRALGACVPLGCERDVDCSIDQRCDLQQVPPACADS